MSALHSIRELFRTPDLFCLNCEIVITTEDDYKYHTRTFPDHRITYK